MSLYDTLGSQYDEMISWEARYNREASFFRDLFAKVGVHRVMDAACGTGMHARWFAEWGLDVVAADPSPAMMEASAHNTAGLSVELLQAGFGELRGAAQGEFDAVVCLGNSLPHVLSDEELHASVADFRALLRPGGVLVIHNNNYDTILDVRVRFMPLAARRTPAGQKLFLRFFDFPPNADPLTFNVLVLTEDETGWSMTASSALHRPLRQRKVEALLAREGFSNLAFYGAFTGEPFDEVTSDNLIAVGRTA
jgi:glycine/sarcosine N-methyltransferase